MKHFSIVLFFILFVHQLIAQCPNGGSLSGIELVTNGNFSAGNVGFTSNYTYCNSYQCLFPEGYYAVGPNPTYFHSAFFGNDHTTGTGKFMIVNGAGAANASIWCETMPVQTNTTYVFSFWVSSMVTSSPAILEVSINGVLTGSFCNAPPVLYSWQQCSATWFSGSNTSVDMCIVNQNTALSGNDFGIDDVSFQACNCTSLLIDAGPGIAVCSGDSAQLSASGGVTYVWTPSIGLSDTSISNPFADPLSTTTYSVTIFDSLGCYASDTATVIVNTLPQPVLSNDTAICAGSSAQLNASGGTSFSWTPATGLSGTLISNPIATPGTTTTYHVIVSNSSGCSAEDSLTITINPLPSVSISNDTTICAGSTAQLIASGGTSYSWTPVTGLSNSGIANPMAHPASSTTYHVTVSNAAGCSAIDSTTITVDVLPVPIVSNDTVICLGTTASLHVSGGIDYLWSPATGLSNAFSPNPLANPDTTTTYYVTVSDLIGCSGIDSLTVTVDSPPQAAVSNDTAICLGTFASLNASGGTSYAWSPVTGLNNAFISNPLADPVSTTTYYVTVSDAVGCSTSDSVNIAVHPLPLPTISNDTTICKGTLATLLASGGALYTWNNGVSGDSITVLPSVTTSYNVQVTDSNNCIASAYVTVSVDLVSVTISGDDEICVGESTTLQSSGAYNYAWNTGSLQGFITISPDANTVYSVVGDDGLCSDSASVEVKVDPLPNVDAGPDLSIVLGDETTLQATGGISCLWSPDTDLSCADCCSPNASPRDTTLYIVTVTDANGCSSKDSVLVIVIPPDDILFPDAFTPNGDGLNDQFLPILSGHTQMKELSIFNRWGQLIFISTNPYSGWDGSYKGTMESTGTYVYSFVGINTINGKTINKKGNVTVLR